MGLSASVRARASAWRLRVCPRARPPEKHSFSARRHGGREGTLLIERAMGLLEEVEQVLVDAGSGKGE